MIVAVKLVFTAATLAYLVGFLNRTRNNPFHQKMMLLGFVLTLGIAVVLIVGVHVFGSTYAPAQWLVGLAGGDAGAKGVLIAHRALSTLTLVVLIMQIVTGWRRHPWHHRLYRAVVPLWCASYLTGLVIFV